MKLKTSNSRILSSLVLSMTVASTTSILMIHATATETTISYANPAPVTPTLGSISGAADLTISGSFAVGDMIRLTGTSITTNPFGSTGTTYYVVAVGAGTIEVATTPGGTPLSAANTTSSSPTSLFPSWQAAITWTGGVAPNDTNLADSDNVIADLTGTIPSGLQGLSVSGNVTVGGIKFSAIGNSDISIAGGGNGTNFGTLTFASSTGDFATPYIEHMSGTARLLNFGGSGAIKFAGTQGVVIRSLSAGAVTGNGLAAISSAPAKNIRFQNIDWSSFSGGVTVERGELGAQASNQLGTGVTAQNLTVGNAQTIANNLLAGFQFGSGGQAIGTLNGNALGRIWATNDTLTIGTNNATGGDYAGSIGKDFTGASTDTDITKTGSGTQTISGIITGTGTVNANGASGTLILSGDNSFTGGATLSAGTLALGHANAIFTNNLTVGGNGIFDNISGAPISLSGGLVMTGGSPTFTGTNDLTFNGPSMIGNGVTRTVTVTGGTLMIAGSISEPVYTSSSSLAKSGAGTLVLGNANSYTGLTTINTGGILKIGNPASLGGATANSAVTTTNGLTTATVLSVQNLLVGQWVTGTNIPANTTLTAIDIPTLTITLSQAATGSGTNSATFEGMTNINPGGTLDLNGQTISESLNAGLDGIGAGGIGALINSNTGTAAEVASEIVNVGLFTVGGAGDLTLNQVHHTGSVTRNISKVGTGKLTLSGSTDNTRYGLMVDGGTVLLNKSGSARAVINSPLKINAGLVKLTGSGSDQINNSDALQVDGGTFDMNGKSETVVAINAIAAGGVITNNGGSASTLTFGGTSSTGVYAGTIHDGSNSISLIKINSGSQTLTGTLAYSGNTTVTDGTLSLNSASLDNASTVSIAANAVLDLNYSGTDTVGALTIGGIAQAGDTYGTTASGAAHVDNTHFTGNGKLLVGAPSGYSGWASTHAGNQAANLDVDNDGVSNGVEYFMNSASGFTANPGVVSGKVTWPNGGNIASSAYGTEFLVQISSDLTKWTNVLTADSNLSNTSGAVQYTLPTGSGNIFARLVVTPN
ncbi:MAG: autotransporter-associated beta strand repeat-containing protein [Luteolibacter sp.]